MPFHWGDCHASKNVLLSCAAAACLTVASNASATDSLNEFKHIVVIY